MLDGKQVREQLLLDLRDPASTSEAVTEIARAYRLSEPAESRLRAQVAGQLKGASVIQVADGKSIGTTVCLNIELFNRTLQYKCKLNLSNQTDLNAFAH